MPTNAVPPLRRRLLLCCLLAGLSWPGCGPTSAVSRPALDDDGGPGSGGAGPTPDADGSGGAPGTGGSPGTGGGVVNTGGSPGTGGSGTGGSGTGGSGTGGAPAVDTNPPPEPDAMVDEPIALPPDLAVPRQALLVVGDPAALTAGDSRLKAALVARGFTVVMGDDGGSTSDANRMDLVVIASSSVSAMVAAKFRDVAIPVLDLESAIYDDMKMTNNSTGNDFDEEDDRRIIIVPAQQAHPLAAGLTGTITVNRDGTDPCCGINWGKPAASAVTIASYTSLGNGKIAIFAYEKAAKMIDNFAAPARRVGFFAADTSMENLTADGLKLLNAAISWAAP